VVFVEIGGLVTGDEVQLPNDQFVHRLSAQPDTKKRRLVGRTESPRQQTQRDQSFPPAILLMSEFEGHFRSNQVRRNDNSAVVHGATRRQLCTQLVHDHHRGVLPQEQFQQHGASQRELYDSVPLDIPPNNFY